LRRIEYLAKPLARTSGALTVDEMTQLAHSAFICFAHYMLLSRAAGAVRATPPYVVERWLFGFYASCRPLQ
jgi:hypothetical protein